MDKILQCCYTNAAQESGGKLRSGWQAVAVSPDLPPEAYRVCIGLQNANSAMQGTMTDERGHVLNLLQFCGDGSYLYMIRSQYGLLDRLGRPNMFSHALIIPWKDSSALTDPNSFLTIANENFKNNEADAETLPASLSRTPAFQIENAMEEVGLDAATYGTLIRCVYTQMSERKAASPLYIQYDGTERQLRATLYCIYYGLPYYLRKNLRALSAPAGILEEIHLVFSEHAEKKPRFLHPRTGQNNILSSRAIRKIERYGYIDFPARNVGKVNVPAYFAALEQYADKLGDPSASNELVLKIAAQMKDFGTQKSFHLEKSTDEELDEKLSDALRCKYNSQLLDLYTAHLLDAIRERGVVLTAENEANLSDRLAASCAPILQEAGKRYALYRFAALPPAEAASKLAQMDDETFAVCLQGLFHLPTGAAILDHYCAAYALEEEPLDWGTLDRALNILSHVTPHPESARKAEEKAWMLFTRALARGPGVREDYKRYMNVLTQIAPPASLPERERAAKEAFWAQTSIEAFTMERYPDYKTLYLDTPSANMFLDLYTFLNSIVPEGGGEEQNMRSAQAFASKDGAAIQACGGAAVIQRIVDIVDTRYQGTDAFMKEWVAMAARFPGKEACRGLIAIRRRLYQGDYGAFVSVYEQFIHSVLSGNGQVNERTRKMLSRLNQFLFAVCIHLDTDAAPVPLDVWLAVSREEYENAFRVFDLWKPAVLSMEAATAVAGSSLFPKRKAEAETYIQERGTEARTVKKWLIEMKKTASENNSRGKLKLPGRKS